MSHEDATQSQREIWHRGLVPEQVWPIARYHNKESPVIDLMTETLIPILDVKKIVPVSTPTLRRWTASGKLATVKAGGKVLTSREAVHRMLQPGPNPAMPVAVSPERRKQILAAQARVADRFARFAKK